MKLMSKIIISMLMITAVLNASSVFAYAGKVVFAYGSVTAEDSNGVVRTLSKKSEVNSGDLIKTANKSMVQIRMIDKAFLAIRSNSEMRIDAYNLGAKKEEDQSLFSLLKGGFRAVTGIIGKRFKKAYRMRTVTATIGIRGTDYTARLCNQDCDQGFANVRGKSAIADGLYVGVNEGGVDLTNDLGRLSLDELQFGYVKDATTSPVALPSAPEFLFFNSKDPDPDASQARPAETETATETVPEAEKKSLASRSTIEPPSADVNSDDTIKQALKVDKVEVDQEQVDEQLTFDQSAETESGSEFSLVSGNIASSRMVTSSYQKSAVRSNIYSAASVSNNELISFENTQSNGSLATFTKGNASGIELGYDPSTGIAWGRWGAGIASVNSNGSSSNIDLTTRNIHWVVSPEQTQNIALPSSGTASYNLVGNTSPTDNFGNTGILGTATLNANFTNSTVDSTVAVGINNNVWNASAQNLPINSNGGFSGNFNSVTVNTGDAVINGSGNAAGFFTQNGAGAGMTYSLDADINGANAVNGSAAFVKQ